VTETQQRKEWAMYAHGSKRMQDEFLRMWAQDCLELWGEDEDETNDDD